MRRRSALLAFALGLLGAVPIPLVVDSPVPPVERGADERYLIARVNDERAQRNLTELAPDERLTAIALAHALDMARRRYFGHDNPDGRTYRDRLIASGYAYRTAAENIAKNADAPRAHDAFMQSPHHRDAILNREFTRIGIAVVSVGPSTVVVVEEFARDRTDTLDEGTGRGRENHSDDRRPR